MSSGDVVTDTGAVTTAASSRVAGVDVARGVALLGMMAVHVLPTAREDGSPNLLDLVVSGRSAALFAVLAGVGLALAYGARPPLGRTSLALVVRAALIGAVGLALGSLESGVAVILAYYAVLFVLVLPWLRASPRVLLGSAAAIAVVVPVASFVVRDELPDRDPASPGFDDLAEPGQLASELLLTGYYPAAAWVAYLLVGLAVARLGLRSARAAVRILVAGALLAALAAVLSALVLGPLGGYGRIAQEIEPKEGFTVEEVVDARQFGNVPTVSPWWLGSDGPHTTTPFDLAGTTGTALLVLGLALLVAPRVRPLLAPLAAAGSMPLSLYAAHVTVLGTTDSGDPLRYYLLQVVAALVLALVWRRLIGRGPLEWAVAAATRPLRRPRT